jgi:hypothetical protein
MDILSEFDVPIREVEEVFPTVVVGETEVDLDEGAPLGSFGFANELEAGLVRGAVGLVGVAGDAGADDVLPGSRAAAVAGDDVVEVEVFAVEGAAAVLACVFVAFEDVVPGERDFLLGETVEDQEENDTGDADLEGDGVDRLLVGDALREVTPFGEAVGLKGAIRGVEDDLGVTFEEEGKGAPDGADIDGLPEPVENENMLV